MDFLYIWHHDQVPWPTDGHTIELGYVLNLSNYGHLFINFECLWWHLREKCSDFVHILYSNQVPCVAYACKIVFGSVHRGSQLLKNNMHWSSFICGTWTRGAVHDAGKCIKYPKKWNRFLKKICNMCTALSMMLPSMTLCQIWVISEKNGLIVFIVVQ